MIVVIRGGGDLASGIAVRLFRAGLQVVILELDKPLAIRRRVSFAEAVYSGETMVEEIPSKLVNRSDDKLAVLSVLAKGKIAVVVDPQGEVISALHSRVVVDARMLKKEVPLIPYKVELVIGLGPGFTAGTNCHAVIETHRSHTLGRVYWHGTGSQDTGIPDGVRGHAHERVLRSPKDGRMVPYVKIGDQLIPGQIVAEIEGQQVISPFKGVLRGLIHPDVIVTKGMKIGDVDPRNDPKLCELVSDKALAVGGGVMEAILARPALRRSLWQ